MRKSVKNPLHYLIIVMLIVSCSSGYEEKDGKIYYKWIHGGTWTTESTLVKDADASTFKIIENNINLNLGKDKNYVFKDASILEDADPV